jgi:hypothetical protein
VLATSQSRIFCLSRLLSKDVKIKTYTIIILPVVVYGCEIRSLTSREEHRLRVFDKKVLRGWGWRKLHNEELRNFFSPMMIT